MERANVEVSERVPTTRSRICGNMFSDLRRGTFQWDNIFSHRMRYAATRGTRNVKQLLSRHQGSLCGYQLHVPLNLQPERRRPFHNLSQNIVGSLFLFKNCEDVHYRETNLFQHLNIQNLLPAPLGQCVFSAHITTRGRMMYHHTWVTLHIFFYVLHVLVDRGAPCDLASTLGLVTTMPDTSSVGHKASHG